MKRDPSYFRGKRGNKWSIRKKGPAKGERFSINDLEEFKESKEAFVQWQKLHQFYLSEEEKTGMARRRANANVMSYDELWKIRHYLVGLQEWIEEKAKEEQEKSKTLTESTVVRWKELAGIL